MLEALLDDGYEYAFVSNSDNLGAVLDPRIARAGSRPSGLPFLMEVVPTAPRPTARAATSRGGARTAGSCCARPRRRRRRTSRRLQDIGRHRYVNTNNLWVDLRALDEVLRERDGVLGLPMIVNRKTVDPADQSSPEVFQLETAMGAAIEVFEGARALRGPAHALRAGQDDERPARAALRRLRADRRRARRAAPTGARRARRSSTSTPTTTSCCATSTRASRPARRRWCECERFVVRGDVTFGPDVSVEGETELESG